MITQQDISQLLSNEPETTYQWLASFESRVRARGVSLPRDEEVREEFVGIGFRLGDQTLMVKMGEVSEIVDMPECTLVRGTMPWFLGVANVRGNLLPVTDLHGFMLGGRASRRHTARVLIYQKQDVFVGLKVDDILGLKHFYLDERQTEAKQLNENLLPFIDEVYYQGDQQWSVFNIKKLVQDKRFLQITK